MNEAVQSIKQEQIPAGCGEQLHFHKTASQFFYILKGTATFFIEGDSYHLNSGDGIAVYPEQKHRIYNEGAELLEFIVYSQPSANNDRVNL